MSTPSPASTAASHEAHQRGSTALVGKSSRSRDGSGEERRRLHRTHSGRVGLAESVAFILLGVVSGYRSQDWLLRLPADDRGGIELLARQGLIEPSSQDRWQPTADVLYSLCLRDGDDGETATPDDC
jgi:hypothetical protein